MRLRILQELERGERSVSALAQKRGIEQQPNVSKHLKVLQDAGMLKRQQQGNTAFYSIADAMVFESVRYDLFATGRPARSAGRSA